MDGAGGVCVCCSCVCACNVLVYSFLHVPVILLINSLTNEMITGISYCSNLDTTYTVFNSTTVVTYSSNLLL